MRPLRPPSRPLLTLLALLAPLALGCDGDGAELSPPSVPPSSPGAPLSAPRAPSSAPAAGPLAAPSSPPAAAATGLGRDLSEAPPWAYTEEATRALTGPAHRTNVPQLDDAADLLFALGERGADEGEGLLLCNLSITRDRDWDARGLFGANTAPDPTVRVQLGASPHMTIRIPEDTYQAVFSIPNVSLHTGTPLRFSVVDRDLARDDSVGSASADWPSDGRLRLEAGASVMRCALAPRAWTEERVALAAAVAARSVALLREVRPRLNALSPHADAPALDEARRDLHALAALVGWSSPRVAAPRARHDAWLARYWAAHAERVRATMASARRAGSADLGAGLSVRLERLSCASEAAVHDCALDFRVRRSALGGRYAPPRAFLIAPGAPAGTCLAPQSSLSARPGLPTSVGGEAIFSARCRAPAAGGAPSSWLVLVQSGASEAAMMLAE